MTDAPRSWPQISLDRVYALHKDALDRHGGKEGVHDARLVESAVAGALTAALYATEGEADPVVFAAYLLCYLARNHGFSDGNKRVAWMAMEEQLRLVKLRVTATTDEAEVLVLQVVKKQVEPEEVFDWIHAHLTGYSF